MAVLRSAGGRSVTFFGPTIMSPEDTDSWPAIMRSVDVLPQPDGRAGNNRARWNLEVDRVNSGYAAVPLRKCTSSSAAVVVIRINPHLSYRGLGGLGAPRPHATDVPKKEQITIV